MLIEVNILKPDADVLREYIFQAGSDEQKDQQPPTIKEPSGIHRAEPFLRTNFLVLIPVSEQ